MLWQTQANEQNRIGEQLLFFLVWWESRYQSHTFLEDCHQEHQALAMISFTCWGMFSLVYFHVNSSHTIDVINKL